MMRHSHDDLVRALDEVITQAERLADAWRACAKAMRILHPAEAVKTSRAESVMCVTEPRE